MLREDILVNSLNAGTAGSLISPRSCDDYDVGCAEAFTGHWVKGDSWALSNQTRGLAAHFNDSTMKKCWLMLVSAKVILWFSHFCLHHCHWVHMKLMSSLRPGHEHMEFPGPRQRLSCSGSSGLVDSETSALRGQAKNKPRPFWEWCIPLIYIHLWCFWEWCIVATLYNWFHFGLSLYVYGCQDASTLESLN